MRSLFILTCYFLLVTLPSKAEITDTPCANGSGVIVKGNVEGTYCLGKVWLNYWNAVAWCDAIEMKLADRTDCICTPATDCSNNKCPNFAGMLSTTGWWLNTPSSEENQWHLNTNADSHLVSWPRNYGAFPLCKNK